MTRRRAAHSVSALLAFAGFMLLGLCVVTALRRQDTLAGGLAVLGLGAMVLAALTPRLTGTVEMGLSGFKLQLVKLSETGRMAGYSDKEILAAIENKLRSQESEHQATREVMEIPKPVPGSYDHRDLGHQAGDALTGTPYDFESFDLHEVIKEVGPAVAWVEETSPEWPAMLGHLGELLLKRAHRGDTRVTSKPVSLCFVKR